MYATEAELDRHLAEHDRDRRSQREQRALEQAMGRAERAAHVASRERHNIVGGPFRPRKSARPVDHFHRRARVAAGAEERPSRDPRRQQRNRGPLPAAPEGPPVVIQIPRDQLGFLPTGNPDIGPTCIGGLRFEATIRARMPSGELRPIEIRAIDPPEDSEDSDQTTVFPL